MRSQSSKRPGPEPSPAPELLPVFQEACHQHPQQMTLSTCLGGGYSPEGSVGGRTAQEAGEGPGRGPSLPRLPRDSLEVGGLKLLTWEADSAWREQ